MVPNYEFLIPAHAGQPYPGCRGRACVYARVSNESDSKTTSMETQAQGEIDALVAAGFFLAREDVRFERASGVNSLAFRDELLELRDLVEDGYYQAFAVHDPDRLVRGMEVVQVVQDMEEAGCEVWLNGKRSEPSDERDLILAFGGYASKKEARQILERTTRARRKITDRGEWYGAGPVRYGLRFDKETRRRVRHETHADLVLRIFEMCAADVSTVQIARTFNAEGIPTPYATLKTQRAKASRTQWLPSTIDKILKEETYLGKAFVNRWRYVRDARGRVVRRGKKKLQELVPRAEWVEVARGMTEQIIPDALWHRANARLRGRDCRQARIDATRQGKRFYLLRGVLHCARCRKRMTCTYRHVGSNKTKYDIYLCRRGRADDQGPPCNHAVGARKIEGIVLPILDALISDPECIASSLALAFQDDDRSARLKREASRAEESLARLDRQMQAHLGDLRDPDLGERSRKAIRGQMRLIEEQMAAMERTLEDLRGQIAAEQSRDWMREEYQERIDRVRRLMAETAAPGPDDYRLFMEGLGLKFFYRKGELEVECQPGFPLDIGSVVNVPGQSMTRLHKNVKMDLPPIKLDLSGFALTG